MANNDRFVFVEKWTSLLVWPTSLAYALYNIYLATTRYCDENPRHCVTEQGWLFNLKQERSVEWSVCVFTLRKFIVWWFVHLIGAEIIRKNCKKYLTAWYLSIGVVATTFTYGISCTLFMISLPITSFALMHAKSKLLLWAYTMITMHWALNTYLEYSLRLQTYVVFYIEMNAIAGAYGWTVLRCLIYCLDYIDASTKPSQSQHVASAEPLQSQHVASAEPLQSQHVASPKPSRRQQVASPKPSRSQHAASTVPSHSQDVSSPKPSRRQQVASPKPSRSQQVASPKPSQSQHAASTVPSHSQDVSSTKPSQSQHAASTEPSHSQHASSTEPSHSQHASSTEPSHSQDVATASLGGLFNFLAFTFYLPLMNTGPIITYRDFISGMSQPYQPWTVSRWVIVCFSLLRYSGWALVIEVATHYMHLDGLLHNLNAITDLDAWAFYGLSYYMGLNFFVAYVVQYGLPSVFARAERMFAPSHPICGGHTRINTRVWRYFDRGLYTFMLKYIYLPCVGSRTSLGAKLLASSVTFTFVFTFHGLYTSVFVWSAMNFVVASVEGVAKAVGSSKEYQKWEGQWMSPAFAQRFWIVLSLPLELFSYVSFTYFFGMSMELGNTFIYKILTQGWQVSLVLAAIGYCRCQTSYFFEKYGRK